MHLRIIPKCIYFINYSFYRILKLEENLPQDANIKRYVDQFFGSRKA